MKLNPSFRQINAVSNSISHFYLKTFLTATLIGISWALESISLSEGPILGEPITITRLVSIQSVDNPSQISTSSEKYFYTHGEPNHWEQYLLELINESRAKPAQYAQALGIDLNEGLGPGEYISPEPKQPLAFNPYLIEAARAHSQWMLDNNIFSHIGKDNSTPTDRIITAGYPLIPPWACGENIAWNGSTGEPNVTQFVLNIHNGLFKSPGHRLNILESTFNEIGIGIKQGKFLAQGNDGIWREYNAVMATENFALSAGSPGPFICGVVYIDRDNNRFYSPGEGIPNVRIEISKGSYYTVTSQSGGYALPFGNERGYGVIEFRIPEYPISIKKEVILNDSNIKVDLELGSLPIQLFNIQVVKEPATKVTFQIAGPYNKKVSIEYSTDLFHWMSIKTISLTNGWAYFEEPSLYNSCFYRAVVIP